MTTPDQRFQAALDQAGRYFMGVADVQLAARRLAARLDQLGIPYAICGGLAVAAHGHQRMTRDVDILLTQEGLQRFHQEALGRGWLQRFAGSRGVRDTEHEVPIDILVAGSHPGDGQPRGVTFPDPATASEERAGLRILTLPRLIELKLVSGLLPHRLQDLADVIHLIRRNALQPEFAAGLHPVVQERFRELWRDAQRPDGED